MPLLFLEVWLFPFHSTINIQKTLVYNFETKIEMNTQVSEMIILVSSLRFQKHFLSPKETPKQHLNPLTSNLFYDIKTTNTGWIQHRNKTFKDSHDNKKHKQRYLYYKKKFFFTMNDHKIVMVSIFFYAHVSLTVLLQVVKL